MIQKKELVRGDKKQLAKLNKDFEKAVKEATELHVSVMENRFVPKSHCSFE